MGPFITALAWTADELEHKQRFEKEIAKWAILIFKKENNDDTRGPQGVLESRKLWV